MVKAPERDPNRLAKSVTRLRLPDFVIAGAPRSATTWLWHLLNEHQDVYMAEPVVPEPKFFLVDELYQKGLEFYSETWFAAAPPGKLIGEKTTNYLESPIAAARIHEHIPEVKLVFIFRNPVDRAYSNYLWTRLNGLETETFDRALELEEERTRELPEQLKYARPYSYIARGFYSRMLQPYFDLFPPHQILCLRTEDIYGPERREHLITKLHSFLGVTPCPEHGAALSIINASIEPEGEPMSPATRAFLEEQYRESNCRLLEFLGGNFDGWPGQ
ncbi:MAG: sulfotransferase [Rhodospirillales bacterium]|nr:sulfotransferase [Rhodospirillales bacterium]